MMNGHYNFIQMNHNFSSYPRFKNVTQIYFHCRFYYLPFFLFKLALILICKPGFNQRVKKLPLLRLLFIQISALDPFYHKYTFCLSGIQIISIFFCCIVVSFILSLFDITSKHFCRSKAL